jgi:hypothetical protein
LKPADLDDITAGRIRRRAAKDTLLLVDHDAVISERLVKSLELLRNYDRTSYDELLTKSKAILGVNVTGVRPTKAVLRIMLSEVAKKLGQMEFADVVHDITKNDPSSVVGDGSDGSVTNAASPSSKDGVGTGHAGSAGDSGNSKLAEGGKNAKAEEAGVGSGSDGAQAGSDPQTDIDATKLFGSRALDAGAKGAQKPTVKTK